MILESNFEKEFTKHIMHCREEYYSAVTPTIEQNIKNLNDKSNLNIKKCEISEKMYKESYVIFAENVKNEIIKKFIECKLEHRLNIINSFYSEFWKIGFSWKNTIDEVIIFFTFNDDGEIFYECYKSDYSEYVKNEFSSHVSTINTPFPNWFMNSLKSN